MIKIPLETLLYYYFKHTPFESVDEKELEFIQREIEWNNSQRDEDIFIYLEEFGICDKSPFYIMTEINDTTALYMRMAHFRKYVPPKEALIENRKVARILIDTIREASKTITSTHKFLRSVRSLQEGGDNIKYKTAEYQMKE